MMVDVCSFILLLLVFTLGFGLAFSILRPVEDDAPPWARADHFLGRHVLYSTWWGVVGNFDPALAVENQPVPTVTFMATLLLS
eukprot:6510163-Prymnesium_polylepis.1